MGAHDNDERDDQELKIGENGICGAAGDRPDQEVIGDDDGNEGVTHVESHYRLPYTYLNSWYLPSYTHVENKGMMGVKLKLGYSIVSCGICMEKILKAERD